MEANGEDPKKSVIHGSYNFRSAMHAPVLGGNTLKDNPVANFNAALDNFQKNYCVGQNILSLSSADFNDTPYTLNVGELGVYLLAVPISHNPSKNFPDMLSRRKESKEWPNVTKNGLCPSVGTSFVMILDVYDGDTPVGKYMVLTTREKKDGLWGAAISGYVNGANFGEIDKNGVLNADNPVTGTMQNEVHEEAILMKPDGKWLHWHFQNQDENKVTIFGNTYDYSDGKIEVQESDLPNWLKCSKCFVEGRRSNIFLNPDPKNNSGQFVDCGVARIDLRDKLSFIHSESAACTKEIRGEKVTLIEERMKPNGIILMELDNAGNPTGSYKKLVMGELIDVEKPATLSEIFSIKEQEMAFEGMEFGFPVGVAVKNIVDASDFHSSFQLTDDSPEEMY